jgi:ACS family hexuronate transporter-like MFS transporter
VAALAAAPLAPFLRDALDLSRAQVGLFLPALYLGGVLMAVPAGWLADRLGVPTTLALGHALTGAAVALATLTPSLPAVLAWLTAAGFGFSVSNPATGRAVMEWFPPRQRGLAMGVKQTGLTLGGVLGALVLPPVAAALGWRRAFVTAGLAALLSAILVAVLYRRPPLGLAQLPRFRNRRAEISRGCGGIE